MKKVKFLDQLTGAGHGNSVLMALSFVLAFVALLSIISLSDCIKTRKQEDIAACQAEMRGVQSALELYYKHYKCYPDNITGIEASGTLYNNGLDSWQNKFKYQLSGHKGAENSNYQLGSAGPDGKFGTEDDVAPPINPEKHSF